MQYVISRGKAQERTQALPTHPCKSKMSSACVSGCVCVHTSASVYLSTYGKVHFNYHTVINKRKLQRNMKKTRWRTAQNTYRLARQVGTCCRTLNNGLKTSLLLPISEALTTSHIISLSYIKHQATITQDQALLQWRGAEEMQPQWKSSSLIRHGHAIQIGRNL